MSKFVEGGAGHGKDIVEYVRELEGRRVDQVSNVWGPIGRPVKEMDWGDLVVYLEEMEFPEPVVKEQRESQWSGKDLQEVVENNTDSNAITKVMGLFTMNRKDAVRCINNVKARIRKHAPIVESDNRRSRADALDNVAEVMEQMRNQGFGRYHGSEVFAGKLAGNRGVDAILNLIDEGDDETCLGALRVLHMMSDSSEERPTEASASEADRRFDKRKLIVKGNGTHILLQVLGPGDGMDREWARPEECQEIALRILRSLTVFPSHWIGWSGDDMTHFYHNTSTALIQYGFPVLLNATLHSGSHEIQRLGTSLITDLMFDDDSGIKRTSGVLLTSSFYVEPKLRQRGYKGNNTPSSSRASTAASSRPSTKASSAAGSLETPKEPLGPRRKAIAASGALEMLLENAGGGVDRVSGSGVPTDGGWPTVGGRVIMKALMAKGLPKADRMGESDPFLRVFVEDQEQRTEVKDDTNSPQWTETLRFDVQDIATARLVVLVFDQNDNAPDKFMCMTWFSLADFVAGAHESGSVEEPRNLSETELLSKMQKGEKNPVVRTGPSHKVDDWFELCERNGKKPTLTGVLGCIHINLEVKTVYRHNRGKLDIQAESMAALHILLSSSAMRDQLRGRPDRFQETNATPGPSDRRPSTLGNRRGSDAALGGSRPGTHVTSVSGHGAGDILNPEVALGPLLGKLVLTAVRMLGTDSIKAQSSAAAVIADLSMEDYARGAIIACGAVLHLLNCLDQGSPQAKLCACNALSLLSLSEDFPEKILNPGGHLSAGSDGMRPVVDVITGIGQESDDVASSALSILNNACLNSKACADRILLSRAPVEVVQRMHVYRCDARAEGSSLLALLTQDVDNRRVVATFSGRLGDKSSTVLEALSTALCTVNNPTDFRSEVGALDARAAAASALSNLSRYGGLSTLVHAVAEGGQEIKTEAASAMAKIADEDSEKDVIVATGVVDSLLEMIILSSTPRARLMAGRVLAKVSEPGSMEALPDAMNRVRKVCTVVPRFGVNVIVPTIDILLRSVDEKQRAVAAHCLMSWCMDRTFAREAWLHGSEPLVDLLMEDPKVNPDGVYYAVQAIISFATHEDMQEEVATFSFMWEGEQKSVMKAIRTVLRKAPKDITGDASGIFYTLWQYGGLEQLTHVLVESDATPLTLKCCAQNLQPLCSKAPTRKRIAEIAKKDVDSVGVWLSSFIIAEFD